MNKKDKLKYKEEWAKELDDLLCLRMNRVINEKGHAWWENTTEEVVKVQKIYDSLREDFIEIDKLGEYVIKKQHEILSFNWLDDTLFDKWMAYFFHAKQLELCEIDNDEIEQDELQIIDTSVKEEEDKGKQPIVVTSMEAQTDDLAIGKSSVIINLLVQDDMDGEA